MSCEAALLWPKTFSDPAAEPEPLWLSEAAGAASPAAHSSPGAGGAVASPEGTWFMAARDRTDTHTPTHTPGGSERLKVQSTPTALTPPLLPSVVTEMMRSARQMWCPLRSWLETRDSLAPVSTFREDFLVAQEPPGVRDGGSGMRERG